MAAASADARGPFGEAIADLKPEIDSHAAEARPAATKQTDPDRPKH